jgi:hypothetical protein
LLSATIAVAGDDRKQNSKDHSAPSQQAQGQSGKNDKDDHESDTHGRKHMKFTQEGEFASVSTSGSNLNFNLSISRGSSSTSPASTFLNFSSFQISDDGNTQTVTSIFGEIPNGAFTGNSTSNLALNLDTSTLDPAVSSSQTCVIQLNPLSATCEPGTLGVIQLTFQENGVTATKVLKHEEEDIVGPVTTLLRSTSDNGSANVQGSVFGIPVASSFATVGVNHSSSIEVTRH